MSKSLSAELTKALKAPVDQSRLINESKKPVTPLKTGEYLDVPIFITRVIPKEPSLSALFFIKVRAGFGKIIKHLPL
ncbi:hypothetical protein OLMES_3946 [Oleiphilus messinensis]|uniref:Uncharacterized protein n=1 Tax=Oleiphilus messinensis TaxID=141451 RepID=A0A1Y0IER4_9GAMM|nr:hypothetical protein OLMES_3946 [Oleiphilus messinensis]